MTCSFLSPASFLLLETCPLISTSYLQGLQNLKLQTNLKVVSGEANILNFLQPMKAGGCALKDYDLVLLDHDLSDDVFRRLRALGCPDKSIVMVTTDGEPHPEVGLSCATLPFGMQTIVSLLQNVDSIALSIVRSNTPPPVNTA